MSRRVKVSQAEPWMAVVWTRLPVADVEELHRREEQTGATVAAQIRVIVRDALKSKRRVIK